MPDLEDDLPTALAYVRYEWDCPCGETNDVDHDPAGETLSCDGCGAEVWIAETR